LQFFCACFFLYTCFLPPVPLSKVGCSFFFWDEFVSPFCPPRVFLLSVCDRSPHNLFSSTVPVTFTAIPPFGRAALQSLPPSPRFRFPPCYCSLSAGRPLRDLMFFFVPTPRSFIFLPFWSPFFLCVLFLSFFFSPTSSGPPRALLERRFQCFCVMFFLPPLSFDFFFFSPTNLHFLYW